MEELHLSQEVWDLIYPVGTIKKFTNNIDPNVLYGGTWQKLEGVFLFASDSNHPLGSTGGEESHTLTVAEIPSHDHDTYGNPQGNIGYGIAQTSNGGRGGNAYCVTMPTGGGQAHNNMPPYKSVNVWERIA